MSSILSIIVAVSENGVIGLQGTLPWRLSADLQRFKRLTWGHTLLMGRRTYESIGRPLPGRTSIVLTHRPLAPAAGVHSANSLDAALALAESIVVPDPPPRPLRTGADAQLAKPFPPSVSRPADRSSEIFVIGGHALFAAALLRADRLYWTSVHSHIAGDVDFPPIAWDRWQLLHAEKVGQDATNEYPTTFQIFARREPAESSSPQ